MRMLCEAARAECDSLEADVKQANVERTKAANGPLGADGKPIEAKVEKIDDDSFRLVHQSQRYIGNSNTLFLHAQRYRRAEKRSICAVYCENSPLARFCRSLRRPVGAEFDAL